MRTDWEVRFKKGRDGEGFTYYTIKADGKNIGKLIFNRDIWQYIFEPNELCYRPYSIFDLTLNDLIQIIDFMKIADF